LIVKIGVGNSIKHELIRFGIENGSNISHSLVFEHDLNASDELYENIETEVKLEFIS